MFAEYERILRMRNVLDFDDMLVLTVRLLAKSDAQRRRFSSLWSYVHVDEFQDTNRMQVCLLPDLT